MREGERIQVTIERYDPEQAMAAITRSAEVSYVPE